MKEFKPPHLIEINKNKSIFLAGTIDMGNSEDWQSKVKNYFISDNINIFNPRRDDWDSSWIQTYENANFYQQVDWEMDALDRADVIIMNFLGESLSPITLLELGLWADSRKLYVCCEDKYWRKGNIQIVCNKKRIPLYYNLDNLLAFVKYNLL